MAKTLAKIHSPDRVLNQVQDQLIQIVNPVLRTLGTKPTVSGSRGGNAALASLLSALAQLGLITDSTTT